MAWRHVEVGAERVRFVQAAAAGEQSFASLCALFEISRPTGYLWLRFREDGVAGMSERSRRPVRSPARLGSTIEEQIVILRQRYLDWGARKLPVLLEREGVVVPSIGCSNGADCCILWTAPQGSWKLSARTAEPALAVGLQEPQGIGHAPGSSECGRPQPLRRGAGATAFGPGEHVQ